MQKIAAIILLTLSLAGCTTALDRWETSSRIFIASNNTVAIALNTGKMKAEDGRSYQQLAKVVNAALDGWMLTISLDGKTDDGASRAAALSALSELRSWLARTLTKQ